MTNKELDKIVNQIVANAQLIQRVIEGIEIIPKPKHYRKPKKKGKI